MYCNKFTCTEADTDECDELCYYCDYSSCGYCSESGNCVDEVE